MNAPQQVRRHQVVVIGGGQAGLAVGHLLADQGVDLVILDGEHETGDQWLRRWKSLRLFTPAQHDSLPGYPFPATRGSLPGREDVAKYLVDYASQFDLPVLRNKRVTRVDREGRGFRITATGGDFTADAVIVATGACDVPSIPEFSEQLDPRITQMHSHTYSSPSATPAGKVLVVGYGTSGAEIAEELAAAGRSTSIAGKPTPTIPEAVLHIAGSTWWMILNHVLTIRTPMGRKIAPKAATTGAPLIRITPRRVRAAGVHEVGRIVSALKGAPALADGSTVDADLVIWCTGYRGDFSWINVDGLTTNAKGYIEAPFGFPRGVEGLGFLGMPFQSKLASPLLGGVGGDARIVAARIVDYLAAIGSFPTPADSPTLPAPGPLPPSGP